MPASPRVAEDHHCDACPAAARLAARPSLVGDVLRGGTVDLLVMHHASAVDQALLALTSADDLVGAKSRPGIAWSLIRFARRCPDVDLRSLVAAAVVGGLLRAQPTLRELKLPAWWSEDDDQVSRVRTKSCPAVL